MSPEIMIRKLSQIEQYLHDFQKSLPSDYQSYIDNHYALERLIELLIISAVDILFHLGALRKEPPANAYSAAFMRAAEWCVIDAELAKRLARAAGLRNILVHGYEDIDHEIIFKSLPQLQQDISDFIAALSRLPEITQGN